MVDKTSVYQAIKKSSFPETVTGRFDSSKPNQSNSPESDAQNEVDELSRQLTANHLKLNHVDPLRPKTGVELKPGRKYLLVVDVRNQTLEYIEKLAAAAPKYEEEFRARGLEVIFLATQWPMQVYELEGK